MEKAEMNEKEDARFRDILGSGVFKIKLIERAAGIGGRALGHWLKGRRPLSIENRLKLREYFGGLDFKLDKLGEDKQ